MKATTQLDKYDRKVLERARDEGPCFFSHYHYESRAAYLARRGLLHQTSAVYSMKAGGKTVEYRNLYKLTDAGRRALATDGGGA